MKGAVCGPSHKLQDGILRAAKGRYFNVQEFASNETEQKLWLLDSPALDVAANLLQRYGWAAPLHLIANAGFAFQHNGATMNMLNVLEPLHPPYMQLNHC